MTMEYHKKQCTVCGCCIEVCPTDARKLKEDGIEVEELRCVDCKVCTEVCEADATDLPDEQIPKKPEGA